MEQTNMASFSKLTKEQGSTTAEPHASEFCQGMSNDRFTTLDSSVPYFINAALNAPVAIVTTFANLLVLLAMRHVNSIRLPSKLLLCSLALADLAIGLLAYPQRVAFFALKMGKVQGRAFCLVAKSNVSTITLFSGVSLFTMTAISIDRYIALFFYLKYQQIVTARRVCVVLIVIWVLSLFNSSMTFWDFLIMEHTLSVGLIICLITTSLAYINIYRALRGPRGQQIHPRASTRAESQAQNSINVAKYRRTASAMLCVYILSVICSLPMFSIKLAIVNLEYTALLQCVYEGFITLFLLSSCLNPVVYCLRVPEVRARVSRLCKFRSRISVAVEQDATLELNVQTNT